MGDLVFEYPVKNRRCTLCPFSYADHSAFKRHVNERHHGVCVHYICAVCEVEFSSIHSVSVHFGKKHRGARVDDNIVVAAPEGPPIQDLQAAAVPVPAVDNPTFQCPYCSRAFPTSIGLGVHKNSTHPEDYNAELLARNPSKRSPWTTDDDILLALEEIKLRASVRHINVALQERFPHRSNEAIRKRRQRPAYAELVLRLEQGSLVDEDCLPVDEGEHGPSGISDVRSGTDECGSVPALSTSETSPVKTLLWAEVLRLWPISSLAMSIPTVEGADLSTIWEAVALLLDAANDDAPPGKSIRRKKTSGRPKPFQRRIDRRTLNRRYQQLYRSNKSRLLEVITTESGDVPPAHPCAADIQATFGELFSQQSPEDPVVPPAFNPGYPYCEVARPISGAELSRTLKRMQTSAPGPDGVMLVQLRNTDSNSLLILYNLMLFFGNTPDVLRRSKTVLIPKKGDLAQATNWRPLTISSVVVRVFHSILAGRLSRAYPFHPGQRAFRPLDGVSTAVACLSALIADRRKTRRPLCVVSLDIAKAFDSVSHHSIERRLRALNIHPVLTNYIINSYAEATTSINCGQVKIENVAVNRGVKQGDPLSPFLFNSILDELLHSIPDWMGATIGAHKLPIIAYADDLLLYTDSPGMMTKLLERVTEFFRERALMLNVQKCASLSLIPLGKEKKMAHSTVRTFQVGGEFIPCVTSHMLLKYLGFEFSPKGKLTPSLDSCHLAMRKVMASPLRPHQKVDLIKTCVIPEMIFRLSLGIVPKKTLQRQDVLIRQKLKLILHLPHYTNDSFFHASCKDSGLGVPALLFEVPLQALSKIGKLARDPHPAISRVSEMVYPTTLSNHYGKMLLPMPATRTAIQLHWRQVWRSTFAGGGTAELAKSNLSTRWISENPRFGNQYVDKVKLISNTLPTRTTLPKATRLEALCRGGCGKLETMSHISQQCPLGYVPRITRHNKIVLAVGKLAESAHHEVLFEPHLITSEGLRKPDLVIHLASQPHILVVDVTIPWETPKPMVDHAKKKEEYYGTAAIRAYFSDRWPLKTVSFHGFVVSARGGWCRSNFAVLDALKISKDRVRSLCPMTMEQTIKVYRFYMKSSNL